MRLWFWIVPFFNDDIPWCTLPVQKSGIKSIQFDLCRNTSKTRKRERVQKEMRREIERKKKSVNSKNYRKFLCVIRSFCGVHSRVLTFWMTDNRHLKWYTLPFTPTHGMEMTENNTNTHKFIQNGANKNKWKYRDKTRKKVNRILRRNELRLI